MQLLEDRRDRSTRASGVGVAFVGMMLIASTYGMARFGVGLFAPRLALERPALADVVGLAAAAQFVSYAIAAGAAAPLSRRRPRTGLVLAGATATVGCIGVAAASTPEAFIAAVFVGGMGAGFASPALVRVIDAVVADRAASTAQSLVNTGTAVGVIGVGVLTFARTSTTQAWVAMALVCAASAGAVLLLVRRPSGSMAPAATVEPHTTTSAPARWGSLVVPGVAALVVGAGSALIWAFGPLLTTEAGTVRAGWIGWLWIALGVGGLAGPLTGAVVDRLGPRRGWRLFAGVLAAANVTLALALGLGANWLAFAAMAVFGAGYMCLSGVLILWARTVWPGAAGAGTSVLFIALAVGQALGSAGFDWAQRHAGPTAMVLTAAALCVVGGGLTFQPALRLKAASRPTWPIRRWALATAVVSVLVLTASAIVATRHLADSFTPGSMSLGRLVVGSLALGLALLVSRSWTAMTRRDWAILVAVGVLLFGVYNIALNAGAARVDAGTVALVTQVSPVAIALLAVLMLGERVTVRVLLGMVLAFLGVATIAVGASTKMGGDLQGVVLCLVAAFSYAISAVLEKPLVTRLPALQITWVACTVGAVMCLPFADSLRREALVASTTELGWLLFLGVGPTAVAFAAFAFALRHMSASALGITTYLIPPLTIVMSVLLLSEAPPGAAYLGGILTLVGVAVAQTRWPTRRHSWGRPGWRTGRRPAR
jgi:drug/metabolite transporter (DMT)-like permease